MEEGYSIRSLIFVTLFDMSLFIVILPIRLNMICLRCIHRLCFFFNWKKIQ